MKVYKIKDIKEQFLKELAEQYNLNEANAFFNTLIEEYSGLKRLDIVSNPDTQLDDKIVQLIIDAKERLKRFEPVQYITGKSWFYNLTLKVCPDVLIPRPETEELVDLIIKENQTDANLRILDIGTGSGCIAIALKKNLPSSTVCAVDISDKALKIAGMNACRNMTDIKFINCDILNPKSHKLNRSPFNMIVSNPPYVKESEKKHMLANVLEYEPHEALFVKDTDALKYYKAIAEFALKGNLAKNGRLYFEINENLGNEVIEFLKSKGFCNIALKNDLNDKPRMISCNL